MVTWHSGVFSGDAFVTLSLMLLQLLSACPGLAAAGAGLSLLLLLLVLSLLTSSPAISALDPGLEAAAPPSRLTSLMADTGLSPNTWASAVASSCPVCDLSTRPPSSSCCCCLASIAARKVSWVSASPPRPPYTDTLLPGREK